MGRFQACWLLAIACTPATSAISYDTIDATRRISCTVMRPWEKSASPVNVPLPLILWVNGWGYPGTHNLTGGYFPGLSEWAQTGPYIVITDNTRAPKEKDAMACLEWMLKQNGDPKSEYHGTVDSQSLGMAGHSMGGGVVLNAAEIKTKYNIKGVIGMTPWSHRRRWDDAKVQDGPVLILAGSRDFTAPVDTHAGPAFEAVKQANRGGALAVLQGATHNSEAYAPKGGKAQVCDFGRYQQPSTLFWRYVFHGDTAAEQLLLDIISNKVPVELENDNCGGTYPPLRDPAWVTTFQFAGGFGV